LTSANVIHRIDEIPFGKIAHASVALAVCFTILLMIISIFVTAISSVTAGLSTLNNRADSIEHLNEELILRRSELEDYFHLIGANTVDISIVASAERTKERLDNEASDFSEELESHGLSLISRSDLAETIISPRLSLYQTDITLGGSTNAIAAFLSSELQADGYIASLTVNSNDAANDGAVDFTLDVHLRRIGAREAPLEDNSDE